MTQQDFLEVNNKEIEFNNVKLKTIADFYNVTEEEKKILFNLSKGFEETSEKMKKGQIFLVDYMNDIEELNFLSQKSKKIKITMNKNSAFVVSLNAELKKEYQSAKDLKESQKTKKPRIFALYAIEWEESERFWGVRPDGFSFHRNPEEAERFIKDYWDKQPKGEAPDEYSRPTTGRPILIEVSESLYDCIMENGSTWLHNKSAEEYKNYDASHLRKTKNTIR